MISQAFHLLSPRLANKEPVDPFFPRTPVRLILAVPQQCGAGLSCLHHSLSHVPTVLRKLYITSLIPSSSGACSLPSEICWDMKSDDLPCAYKVAGWVSESERLWYYSDNVYIIHIIYIHYSYRCLTTSLQHCELRITPCWGFCYWLSLCSDISRSPAQSV